MELRGGTISAGTLQNKLFPNIAIRMWDVMADLNFNFLHTDVWGLTTQKLLDELEEARLRGIKVAVLLSHPDVGNHPVYGNIRATYPNNPDLAIEIIDKFIKDTALVGHPQIAYWLVYNEPANYVGDAPVQVAGRNWLTRVLEHLHVVDPTHKATIAGGLYGRGLSALPTYVSLPVDLIETHHYSWMYFDPPRIDNAYSEYMDYLYRLKAGSNGLPIVLGEWGVKTHNGYIITESEQATFYRDVFRAMKESDILGNSFFYADPDPGFPEMAGYSVIKIDSNTGALSYKQAAYAVRSEYSTPTPISPIAWWNRRSRLEKTIIISSVPLFIFGIYSLSKGRR